MILYMMMGRLPCVVGMHMCVIFEYIRERAWKYEVMVVIRRKEPGIEPWGTSQVIWAVCDMCMLYIIHVVLLLTCMVVLCLNPH